MTPLDRRSFLQLAALGAAGAALPALSCKTRDPRPNVLFLAFDDLRPWVGCMGGHPDARTPNIDRLAERGVVFTNAHCNVPLCGGSRTAVLTGLLPETNGVFTNHKNFRDDLPEAVTLQQYFMSHGYRSLLGGKVFHVEDPGSAHESFHPSEADVFAHRTPASGYGFPGKKAAFNWGPLDIDGDQLYDAKVADWAAALLRRRHREPFFLSVGFFRPHLPWFVPKEYFEPFPPDRVALPPVQDGDLGDISVFAKWRMFRPLHASVVNAGQWGHAVSAYLATIHYVDAMLGRVLDALDSGPNAAHTVVVLWADHGLHLGEKENWKKFTLWEESTRVPLIVVAPDGVVPGGRCSAPVSLVHLYPTLAELCGLPPPPGVEGRSLGKLLREPAADWRWPAVTSRSDLSHAVRTARWRYILWGDGSEELYDHESDEHEWFNLARKRRYRKLKERLAAWLPPPPEAKAS